MNLAQTRSPHTLQTRIRQQIWQTVWLLLFRPSPRLFHAWRRRLLRLFGAHIGAHVEIYPSVRIWAPWNLSVGDYSALGERVDCYCLDKISIGNHVVVSQDSFLCTAGHDISAPHFNVTMAPVTINDGAWVCARAIVLPGITLGAGAVVAAGAVVTKDVEPWTVVGGNPATFIKKRVLKIGA